MARKYVKGGRKLDAFIRNAKAARGVKGVEVGFFSTSKYPDGTPVTNVAAFNEFGTETAGGGVRTPERPFFRQAIEQGKRQLPAVLRKSVNPRTMAVTKKVAGRLGLAMQGIIQESITDLTEPPNAPSTIRAKRSSNPLIDTGFMRSQVTYRVEGG